MEGRSRLPLRRIYRGRLRATTLVVAAAVGSLALMPADRSSARVPAPLPARRPRPAPTARAAPPESRPVDPARFAPGACVVFAPTSGDRHLTVYLDAGHGGVDPGAIGTTTTGAQVHESDLTLPVELDTMALLRRQGFAVAVSRTGPASVARLTASDVSGGLLTPAGVLKDLAARAQCANEAGAQLLVGIYFDAGSSPANAGSVTGYDAARSFASANLRFADMLQSDVLAVMNAQGWGIPDGGVVSDNYLGSAVNSASDAYGHLMLLGPAKAGYFTTPSRMPGALIEPLFITDPFEASIADSTHGQQVIAAGIAAAVGQYFQSPAGRMVASAH